VHALRSAGTVEYAARELLRARALPLLPRDELIVADGYHRVCAICFTTMTRP
jgi:hypothetical protein